MLWTKRRMVLVVACVGALVLLPSASAHASCHQAFFSPDRYIVMEKAASVVLTVENPGEADQPRTVAYETVAGTAKSGSDYETRSGTLSFSPSDTSETIEIAIVNNAMNEGVEQFSVRLKPTTDSCIIRLGPKAKVSIEDDDPGAQPPPNRESESNAPPMVTPSRGSDAVQELPAADGAPIRAAAPGPTQSAPTLSRQTPADDAFASAGEGDEGSGVSGGGLAGIVAATVLVGGAAAVLLRRRLT